MEIGIGKQFSDTFHSLAQIVQQYFILIKTFIQRNINQSPGIGSIVLMCFCSNLQSVLKRHILGIMVMNGNRIPSQDEMEVEKLNE